MNWMGDLGITGWQIALLRKHMMSSGCSGKSHFQKHVSHLLQGIFSLLPPEPRGCNTTSVITLFSCVGTETPSTNKILSLFSPIYFLLIQYAPLQMRKSPKATGLKNVLGNVVLLPGASSGLLRCEVSLYDQNMLCTSFCVDLLRTKFECNVCYAQRRSNSIWII